MTSNFRTVTCIAYALCSVLFAQTHPTSTGEWLNSWRRTYSNDGHRFSKCLLQVDTEQCLMPRYVAPRSSLRRQQKIPKIIWQTWKSYSVGRFQSVAMMSFIRDNLEYEYILLDDAAALDFICQHTDAKTALAYETLAVGAAKADVLRVAILLEYGGVYVDTDCASLVPFNSFVWPNASMVSGIGAQGDFHQWVLLYVPGHPFLQRALHTITRNIFDARIQIKAVPVVEMTGPIAYHRGGVSHVLESYNCTLSPAKAVSEGMELLSPTTSCANLSRVAGVVQLMSADFLGHNIVFKDTKVVKERTEQGYVDYTAQERHVTTLFQDVQFLCNSHTRTLLS